MLDIPGWLTVFFFTPPLSKARPCPRHALVQGTPLSKVQVQVHSDRTFFLTRLYLGQGGVIQKWPSLTRGLSKYMVLRWCICFWKKGPSYCRKAVLKHFSGIEGKGKGGGSNANAMLNHCTQVYASMRPFMGFPFFSYGLSFSLIQWPGWFPILLFFGCLHRTSSFSLSPKAKQNWSPKTSAVLWGHDFFVQDRNLT